MEASEIEKNIITIRNNLSKPFQFRLDQELKITKDQIENIDLTIKAMFLDFLFNKAKKYQKIDADFPEHIARLIPNPEKFHLLRDKLVDVCVLDSLSTDLDRISDQIYRYLKGIVQNLLTLAHENRSEIIKNILNLLFFFLEKENFANINEKYTVFFEWIYLLTNPTHSNLKKCSDKVNNINQSEYLNDEKFITGRIKFFEIIYFLSPSLIEKDLLMQLQSINEIAFHDNKLLFQFIKNFIFELNELLDKSDMNAELLESIDLAVVLIYLALNKKGTPSGSFFSKINFAKLPGASFLESEVSKKLSYFKKDYKDKKGKDFFENSLAQRQLGYKQIASLCDAIKFYFPLETINRSSLQVRVILETALKKCNYGNDEIISPNKENTDNSGRLDNYKAQVGTLVSTMKTMFDAGINWRKISDNDPIKALTKVSAFTNLIPPALNKNFLQNKESLINQSLSRLKLEVQAMIESLRDIQISVNLYSDQNGLSIQEDIQEDNITYQSDEEYIHLLEDKYIPFIKEGIEKIYIKSITEFKSKFEMAIESYSYFKKEKLSLKERAKLFINQGVFSLKLEKIRENLNHKINFSDTKYFFSNKNFIQLLALGIIRWPWSNKEHFAVKWAEQIILLKTKYILEEIPRKNGSNKANLLELLEISNEVFYTSKKKIFLSTSYLDINQDIKKYLSKLETLLKETVNRIAFNQADSLAGSASSLNNCMASHTSHEEKYFYVPALAF